MIRIAAVGDVHVGADSRPEGLRAKLAQVNDDADVLLVAGDLTKCGTPEEAAGPVLFLASPLSDYVSGAVILVTGASYV